MDNRTLAIALVSVLCILVIFIMASNSSKKLMHSKPPHHKEHGGSHGAHHGGPHSGHSSPHHGSHRAGAGGLNPNLVVFLRAGCGYCDKQKKELEHTPFNYVACGPVDNIPSTGTAVTPPVDCSTITGFPTWYNTETHAVMPGYKTLAQLHSL